MPVAAPEGEERTVAAQTRQEEKPAGEAAAEDSAALPADVAALLNSPGMVETLQRMVAEATAKVQAREAAKVADLERSREMAERLADRQAREHELALRKAKSKQAATATHPRGVVEGQERNQFDYNPTVHQAKYNQMK